MSSNIPSDQYNPVSPSPASKTKSINNPFRINSDSQQQPPPMQHSRQISQPVQVLNPKVRRKDDSLSRSNSINNKDMNVNANAAPATPRMLRHTSSSNNSSNNNSMVLMTDDYLVHPDYQSQFQKSNSQQPHTRNYSQSNSLSNTRDNSVGNTIQDQTTLLPGVDLRSPAGANQSSSKRSASSYVTASSHTPTPSKTQNLARSNSEARRLQQQPQQSQPQSQSHHHHHQQQQQPQQQQGQSQQQQKEFQQFHRKYIGDWEFAKTIGAGSMGKVKLARHRITNEYCAVKVVPRAARVWARQHANDPVTHDQNELAKRKKEYEKEVGKDKRSIREGALGRILYHPSICRLYEMFSMSNHYYMLFEYISGGQLLDYIVAHGSLKEKNARKFCRGIASALDYCHSNNIVHRDLKIENIMISNNGDIKIIDFGLSNLYDNRHLLSTYCGSLYFAAPELLSAHPYTGPEVDVWSFGVVLYVLVCGKVPFDDQSVSALHEKIKRGHVEYPSTISRECVSLLSRMLVVDPKRRATLREVMNHPWMLKGYEAPPSNYLPHRIPLHLPLDPKVIQTIVEYELAANEDQVIMELTNIINSPDYQLCCKNWYAKHNSFAPNQTNTTYDQNIPDPTLAYHPLISIYYLVDEMHKRNKLKEESRKAKLRQLQEQQQKQQNQQQFPTTEQQQQQQRTQPQSIPISTPSAAPSKRIVTQPVPVEYMHNNKGDNADRRSSPIAPTPPVLTFPQAAYTSTSPHQQSNMVAATNLNDNMNEPSGVTSPRLRAQSTQTGMLEADEYSIEQQPQQQFASSHSTQPQQTLNSLFRRFSAKKSSNKNESSTSPQPEAIPPVDNSSIENKNDASGIQVGKLRTKKQDDEGLVRRVGSMKITSKEKQQFNLPPLPSTSKQQIQQHQQTQSQQKPAVSTTKNHHRAASAYTPSTFTSDSDSDHPPIPQQQLQEYQRLQYIQKQQQKQSPQVTIASSQQPTQQSQKFHPSARAKSMGHARKQSLNLGSLMEAHQQDKESGKIPLIPANVYHPDDGFFDDVDITFDSDYNNNNSIKSSINSGNQTFGYSAKKLTNEEIMQQFENAPPGTMPSIEYPRTLFLKGFFSVQTTSTKPLPIIRYDIITVLPQLGVKFTEVKGGFVCMSYPSILPNTIEAVSAANAATGSNTAPSTPVTQTQNVFSNDYDNQEGSNIEDLSRYLEDTESKADTLVIENLPSRNLTSTATGTDNVDDKTPMALTTTNSNNEPPLSQQPTKQGSLSSNSSNSRNDEYQGSPVERGNSTFSNTSTPSKSSGNGHRRKFSLGGSLLGRKKDKLSISTSAGSNSEQITMPTTPAPANYNYMRRGSYGIDDDLDLVGKDDERSVSRESMNSFHAHENDSDMLISSRVEQQNKSFKSSHIGNSPNPNQYGNANNDQANNGLGILSPSTSGNKKIHNHISKNPLKFEIHIVKVPLVGIYGIQFKKLSGNTWLYKSLASEILNSLNL